MSHEPGIFPNISHDEYHKMTDIVSNSYLGRLDKCPAAAKVAQRDTVAMAFGRAFHSFVLDGIDAFERDYLVAARKNKMKVETFEGRTVITPEELTDIEAMYGAIAAHPIAAKLLMEGRSEMSVFWTDEKTGLPCKCRPDRIPDGDHGVILDLKKVRSAEIHAFLSQCMSLGYGREAGMYIEGFNAVSNAKVDAFVFICVEDDPPYRVEVYTLEDLFIEYGRQEFRRLITIEAECRKKIFYPNWKHEEIRTLYLPNYAGGSL